MDYRIYFNRRCDYPWSVDDGKQSSEIQVKDVIIHDVVRVESHYDPSVPRGSVDVPSAWFLACYSTLRIDRHDIAHLYHDPDWRVPRIASIE